MQSEGILPGRGKEEAMRSEKEVRETLDNVKTNLEVAEEDLILRQHDIKELKAKRALLEWILGTSTRRKRDD